MFSGPVCKLQEDLRGFLLSGPAVAGNDTCLHCSLFSVRRKPLIRAASLALA